MTCISCFIATLTVTFRPLLKLIFYQFHIKTPTESKEKPCGSVENKLDLKASLGLKVRKFQYFLTLIKLECNIQNEFCMHGVRR